MRGQASLDNVRSYFPKIKWIFAFELMVSFYIVVARWIKYPFLRKGQGKDLLMSSVEDCV